MLSYCFYFPLEPVGIIPVMASASVVSGDSVDLSVHVDGDPPVSSAEITWTSPRGDLLNTTRSGVHLHRGGKQLSIEVVKLADSGTYHISITRSTTTFSASIHLTVLGMYDYVIMNWLLHKCVVTCGLCEMLHTLK